MRIGRRVTERERFLVCSQSDFGIEVRSELALRPMEEMEISMEELGMPEASISQSSGSSTLSPSTAVVLCQAAIVAGGPPEVSSLHSPCLGGEDVGCAAELGDAVNAAIGAVDGFLDGDGDRGGAALAVYRGVVHFADDGGALIVDGSNGDASGAVLVGSRCSTVVELQRAATLHAGDSQPVAVVSSCSPHLGCDSRPVAGDSGPVAESLFCGIKGLGDGGLVSEEVRVTSVTREALRSQPTDGLRQPPSPPAVPVSGVEGGVGMDGTSGCRSYAHVVQVARRADVELSYIPPTDGRNTIIMEESDGDRSQWGSCLVGHFLQGSLPFGFVRSSVTRQWIRLGLTEVKSLDEGFFVFRFVDSVSRDGVFEGGPWFVGVSLFCCASGSVSCLSPRRLSPVSRFGLVFTISCWNIRLLLA
ncbi:hypothetical protein Dimus_031681 [Dionaea muscipula]